MQQRISWHDTKWDQLGTLLLGRYKGRAKGEDGGYFIFLRISIAPEGAHASHRPQSCRLSELSVFRVSVGSLVLITRHISCSSFLSDSFILSVLSFFFFHFSSPFYFLLFAFFPFKQTRGRPTLMEVISTFPTELVYYTLLPWLNDNQLLSQVTTL